MNAEHLLFWIFSAILLVAAFRVVTARNPVHAVLFLVLAFFSTSCLWMLLRAEFLALALVLVYVGAVMVLFLFVVMMLDINIDRLRQGFWRHFPLGALVGVLIALQLWAVLSHGPWQAAFAAGTAANGATSNITALGLLTFSDYAYPLQVAGVILLVAIVAAIALTLRRRKDTKQQRPSEQVRVRRNERVRMVAIANDAEGRQDARQG
ncbi:MAG TPA: NADH-quinone oxidoreductase subunit J [Burkholderiaceae bacterium]|nr:NADH-quinone oxidoreductase subunit J [Burkholderiaceae bacterium]